MTRTEQELNAMNGMIKAFRAAGCEDMECDKCPIDAIVCAAISNPVRLSQKIEEDYLLGHGMVDTIIDWVGVRMLGRGSEKTVN